METELPWLGWWESLPLGRVDFQPRCQVHQMSNGQSICIALPVLFKWKLHSLSIFCLFFSLQKRWEEQNSKSGQDHPQDGWYPGFTLSWTASLSINFMAYRIPARFNIQHICQRIFLQKKKNLLDPWFYLQRCGCEPHTRKTHVQMSPCGQRRTRDQAHPVCLRCILSFRRHCTNTLINTFKECINQQSHVSWHAPLFNCAC